MAKKTITEEEKLRRAGVLKKLWDKSVKDAKAREEAGLPPIEFPDDFDICAAPLEEQDDL